MLADSGATHHMTEQRSFFSTYRGIPPGTWKVNGFGGVVLSALGIGTIQVTALVNGEPVHGELHEVLHVPGIGPSLFSIGCATAAGMEVLFSDTKVALSVNQNTVIVGQIRICETLYYLKISANYNKERDDSANAAKLKIGTVHQRFAHLNCKDIARMKKTDAVKDLGLEDDDLSFSCEACIFGKMHRTHFQTEGHVKATEVCEFVHGDVGGPTNVSTFDDFKFYSLLKDDYTNYTDVKLIRKKNEVVDHIMEFYEQIENQSGNFIKVFRTDQGREYEGERLATWKKQKGIIHQTTNRYTPQQNGVSERSNQTLMDGVRSSMYNNNSSNKLPSLAAVYGK
jgi:hypothetical protein